MIESIKACFCPEYVSVNDEETTSILDKRETNGNVISSQIINANHTSSIQSYQHTSSNGPSALGSIVPKELTVEINKKVSDPKSASSSISSADIPIQINPYNEHNGNYPNGAIQDDIPQQSTAKACIQNSSYRLKYDLRDEIGVGSTSKCYKCIRKADAVEFACKVIDKRQVELKFSGLLEQFFVEIEVLQKLNHPNIIRLFDAYQTADRIYMVMEVMKGGELFDYVVEKGTLSEEEASTLVRKITSAVKHMHDLDIIHRDLKPENLLLTSKGPDAVVKIIDFGLAKFLQDSVASSFLGTKGYLAPEMLQRHSYGKEIDIWALGVIVFVLLCGCLPFDDDSSRISSETAARKKFTLRFPKWASSLSPSAKDLLHNLLEIDPVGRYTAAQALAHPWVSGKSVIPNSYLQSPHMLGKSRQEMRSPLPKNYIHDMHTKLSQNRTLESGVHNGQSNHPRTQNNVIGNRIGTNDPHTEKGGYGTTDPGRVRKNSI